MSEGMNAINGEWSHIVQVRQVRGCERKKGFCENTARRKAVRYSESEGVLFNAYPCVDCGMWHVGHARDEKGNMIPSEQPKKSSPRDRLDRVITSVPLDRTAAMVTQRGAHYEPDLRITCLHWDAPPKNAIKPLPLNVKSNSTFVDLTGAQRGRLTVMGYFGSSRNGTMWLVRCACGNYETRSSKAIRNEKNFLDCCVVCRKLIQLKRSAYWRATGENLDESFFT